MPVSTITWKETKMGGLAAYQGSEFVATVRETFDGQVAARYVKGQNNKRKTHGTMDEAKEWVEQLAEGRLL